MVRNFIFAFLGLLVGLAVFTYGFATKKTKPPVVAATKATDPRIDELQRTVIIDPVDIRNPDSTAPEVNAQAAATAQPALNQTTQAAANTLANDIIPAPATPEAIVDDGWANAAFLPKGETESDNSALEEEVVQ